MGEFQRMTGAKLPATLTTVAGSRIDLKFIPGKGESAAAPITVSAATMAKIDALNVRKIPNFTTFSLVALMPGTVRLQAGDNIIKPVAGPVTITIEAKLALPIAKSDHGMLVRLLIAETPSPAAADYTEEAAKEAMTMMMAVVRNRLAKPSNLYASQGATKLADVVRAPGQFKGFSDYPTLDSKISTRIDETLAIANNGGDARRAKYSAFVQNAFKIAAMTSFSDANLGKIYFWRTAGSGSPAETAKVYKTVLGNTFYSL